MTQSTRNATTDREGFDSGTPRVANWLASESHSLFLIGPL
jgi:hypothetical protein